MSQLSSQYSRISLSPDSRHCLPSSGSPPPTSTGSSTEPSALSPSRLQDELRYLLNRWDPIGIYDEQLNFPPDEYDCLIGPLLTRLARHDARASLSEYLWYEIEDHFGLDP